MKKENYQIQVGEVFTEQKANELIEFLKLKELDMKNIRKEILLEILDFWDKKGWVYRSEFVEKFLPC